MGDDCALNEQVGTTKPGPARASRDINPEATARDRVILCAGNGFSRTTLGPTRRSSRRLVSRR
jgi:hypothetical protein